jgi:hypothetical protein
MTGNAMTTTPAFSLEAYPLVAKAKAGPAHYTVTVVNKGSKTLPITAHTQNLHGACSKLSFAPSHFTLKPSAMQHVTVTAPSGNADYLAAFSGSISHGGFGVGAAIGTRFVIGTPSSTTVVCNAKAAPLAQPSAGFPVWGLVIIALAVVALAVVGARRLRHGH